MGEERRAYSPWSSTYIYIDINTAITASKHRKQICTADVKVQTFS
jgi:hypothetical protein